MNIEGKISEVLYGLSDLCGSANIDPRIDDIVSICQQEIAEACKKQREICLRNVRLEMDSNTSTAMEIYVDRNSILNAPSPKGDKKYYCKDCGTEMDEGEAKTFTCCEICWDKHYKSPSPKESE